MTTKISQERINSPKTTGERLNTGWAARFLLGLLLFTLPAALQAQFTYTTENGQITITGYTGLGGAVDIPSTINGLPVARIGDGSFNGNTSLTGVTIPNSVTSLGYAAFAGCTRLTSVTIPNSVTNIGAYAFTICTNLSVITVEAPNASYSSVAGVLFDQNQTTLIQCPGGKAGSYTIPDSVITIGGSAFSDCTSLTSVTIPNSVTSLGGRAFLSCTSLTSLTIPNRVTFIGDTAFYGCTSLTNATIGNGVTTIGYELFHGCTSLTSVTIGNGVTSIGRGAFADCTSLTTITIPNSVISIDNRDLFDSAPGAFSGCTSLSAITVEALNASYSSVDGVLFDKSETTLIQYPAGKAGSYTIPDSVITIGWSAFSGCTGLASVTIPRSVTTIGTTAFGNCTGLTEIYFQGNTPSSGSSAFGGADMATVYYLPGTTGWGATFADRPTAPWSLPYPVILSSGPGFGPAANGFGFLISWATNASVVVEASPVQATPIWAPVSTNTLTADTESGQAAGTSQFTDPQWANHPARLYRLVSP